MRRAQRRPEPRRRPSILARGIASDFRPAELHRTTAVPACRIRRHYVRKTAPTSRQFRCQRRGPAPPSGRAGGAGAPQAAASGPGSVVSRCRVQDGPTASLSLSSVIRDDLGVDGTSPSRRPSPSLEKSSPSLTISPVTSFFTCRSGPDSEKPHVSHCSAGRSPPESRRRYRDANSGDGT